MFCYHLMNLFFGDHCRMVAKLVNKKGVNYGVELNRRYVSLFSVNQFEIPLNKSSFVLSMNSSFFKPNPS